MIKFCVLGSGSKGNSTWFDVDGHQFLIDAGFNRKELAKRLSQIGKDILNIEAVFYTHKHTDHYMPGVMPYEVNTGEWTVKYSKRGTAVVSSFEVSHDVQCQGYTVKDGEGNKVALLTDTGIITEEAIGHMLDCSAILIETNYDKAMLENGSYTPDLKARCLSETGHCRNECAAEAIRAVIWLGLKHIVALHLSAAHNEPGLVQFELASACLDSGGDPEIIISRQDKPTKMITIM